MLIYSDTLTETDIRAAVPMGCTLVGHYVNDEWASVHQMSARKRKRSFSVRLSGSGRYMMANLPDRSATWDEWGIFIDSIFTLDPNAVVGVYKDRDDFIARTTDEFNRCARSRPDLGRKAPWLTKN